MGDARRSITDLSSVGALASSLGCVGTLDVPEGDTYATESAAEAMEDEEEEATWRDANR